MDLILIAVFIGVVLFLVWFAWRVGEDKAARLYQADLANERARVRRLRRDLDDAWAEVRVLRERDR